MYRGGEGSSSPSISKTPSWLQTQYSLKRELIQEDDFDWKLPTSASRTNATLDKNGGDQVLLKYVGGVDVSFLKEDPSVACGSLIVLDLQSFRVVYQDYSLVRLRVPYIAGFLAFREVPILLPLIEKMKNSRNPYYPQVTLSYTLKNCIFFKKSFCMFCHFSMVFANR
ncbi:hypothetical protein JCGZ_04851 [Jatropha curcas]|uniref:Uncharacterized protein n=1 Tax=Jatropha curcas TaxID=180498 RepID=A0A067KTF6_JATCU|nr:hypothetical protein JCGZ_04851 [Jatropha curcas]